VILPLGVGWDKTPVWSRFCFSLRFSWFGLAAAGDLICCCPGLSSDLSRSLASPAMTALLDRFWTRRSVPPGLVRRPHLDCLAFMFDFASCSSSVGSQIECLAARFSHHSAGVGFPPCSLASTENFISGPAWALSVGCTRGV
jgi:hypothetical protein